MRESGSRHSLVAEGDGGALITRGFLAVAAIVVVGSAALFAVLSSHSSQPLLLTLMAILVMFGVFFLLGLSAGHLRLTERVIEPDIARSAASALSDGVMVAGKSGEPVYANSAWQALVGRAAAGHARSLDQMVLGETAASEAVFRLMRAAADQRRHSEEFMLAAGGWYTVSVGPLVAPPGSAEGPMTLWTMRDSTAARAQSATRVAALESELADLSALPVGMLVFSEAGEVRRINDVLAGWLGLAAGGARPMRLADLMAEDAGHLLRVLAARSAAERGTLDIELVREDGTRLPVTVTAGSSASRGDGACVVAVLPRDAQTAAVQAAGMPAGDVRAAEARAEPRFARLFQAAPFGIATIAADGRLVSANAAFGRMLLEPSALAGKPVADVVLRTLAPDQRQAAEAAIAQALAGQALVAPIEVPVGPQGEFTRRLYLSTLSASGEAREAAVLFLIDVTEQKALEVKFAQSQKMEAVGKLAGGIAHDFNNVLTAIIGFSDLLLQTHRPTDAAYKDIMNIKSSANRAAGMVRQLLAFSRRQTLQAEVLLLSEVITDLSALLNRAIGERIELKILPGRELWYVKADKTQFEQVMINLAVNAADAMPDGGRVIVRTRNVTERESQRLTGGITPGEYVLVEVEDNGVGMSPEVMSKIFEPFFTTKGVGKGTGLGLATVYGIVKQTGGFVFPQSTPGEGTIFRVYLPRYQADGEEELASQKEKERKKEERPADLTGTGRVLVVEDENNVRSFAVRTLRRQGYEVIEASNGEEGLEAFHQAGGQIDLVVSDVVMPEKDGPTLLKEVRQSHPDMKFILMSGYPDDAFKRNLEDGDQFEFLQKPFSLAQLALKVKQSLGR